MPNAPPRPQIIIQRNVVVNIENPKFFSQVNNMSTLSQEKKKKKNFKFLFFLKMNIHWST